MRCGNMFYISTIYALPSCSNASVTSGWGNNREVKNVKESCLVEEIVLPKCATPITCSTLPKCATPKYLFPNVQLQNISIYSLQCPSPT